MPDLLFGEEVAEITRIPLATLRFYRHNGTGPKSFRLGNRVVYKRADVGLRAGTRPKSEGQRDSG